MAEKISAQPPKASKPAPGKENPAFKEQIAALKTVRDELRVQAHLANLDAKEAWGRIEPHFDELIREAQKAGHVTVGAVEELLTGMKRFIGALKYERTLREERTEH